MVAKAIKPLLDDEYDDDFPRPSDCVIAEATRLLDGMQEAVSVPVKGRVSSSGSGDIRIEWCNGNKNVRLVVMDSIELTYIYWQHGSIYDAAKNVTVDTLIERIRWLSESDE